MRSAKCPTRTRWTRWIESGTNSGSFRVFLFQLLQQVEPLVQPAVERHQFAVRADLGDTAVVEDNNAVGIADGGEAVGDRDDRDLAAQRGERALHDLLGFGIDVRGGL